MSNDDFDRNGDTHPSPQPPTPHSLAPDHLVPPHGHVAPSASAPSAPAYPVTHPTAPGPRLPTCPPDIPGIHLLGTHIDTLDVGIFARWASRWPTLRRQLLALHAQATDKHPAPGILGNQEILVHRKGRGGQRYHIQTVDAHIFIADTIEPIGNCPNIVLSPLSRALRHDLFGTLASTFDILVSLGLYCPLTRTPESALQGLYASRHFIQRLDIAADFILSSPLSPDKLLQADTQLAKALPEYNRRVFQSIQFGKGDTVCRIYDKSAEIANRRDPDETFWQSYGISPRPDVWRVEYQVRHRVLKEFEINDLRSIPYGLPDLWSYLTTRSLCLREADESNPAVGEYTPFWSAVIASGSTLSDNPTAITRRRRPRPRPDPMWHVRQLNNNLAGFAAGNDIDDIDVAMQTMLELMRATYDRSRWAAELRKARVRKGIRSRGAEGEDSRP